MTQAALGLAAGVALMATAAFAAPAEARPNHRHVDPNGNAAQLLGGRPSACPVNYCGCGLARFCDLDPPPKPVTRHCPPPLLDRFLDWSALAPDYRPGDPVGWGATEEEALRNLEIRTSKRAKDVAALQPALSEGV